MSEMNCKQYRAEIEEADSRAGKPTPRAESHAAACAECRTFGDETAALRGLVAGLARVDAPPDFELRLRARIGAADAARPRPRSNYFLPRAAWLAAAGCLALAAALALLTRNSTTPGAREAAALPTAEQPLANPVAGVETTPRAVPAETGGETRAAETRAAELTNAPTELNELTGAKRRRRAASLAAADAGRPAQRGAAAAARPSLESVASREERGARTETSTSSMTSSPIIVSMPLPLPVAADERPLQVLFKDTQGASRVVNVDPVAFGSNEPAARPANVTFTKAAKKQGVW